MKAESDSEHISGAQFRRAIVVRVRDKLQRPGLWWEDIAQMWNGQIDPEQYFIDGSCFCYLPDFDISCAVNPPRSIPKVRTGERWLFDQDGACDHWGGTRESCRECIREAFAKGEAEDRNRILECVKELMEDPREITLENLWGIVTDHPRYRLR